MLRPGGEPRFPFGWIPLVRGFYPLTIVEKTPNPATETSTTAKDITKLRELDAVTSDQLYNAACIYALGASSIRSAGDESLSSDQAAQRESWIDEALASLKQAIDSGWDDFDHMQQDEDLSIIRDHPEFQSLIPESE